MNQLYYYSGWINSRFEIINNCIVELFGEDFYKNKTMLELGAGFGDFGARFSELGVDLTCWEGREENLNVLQQKYPNIKSHLIDIDKTNINNKYNIILNAGILYHLNNVENCLENCLENCDVLILETENIDSTDDADAIIKIEENASESCPTSSLVDSDCTNYSTRTTRKYLEELFTKKNFKYKLLRGDIKSNLGYNYDWNVMNTKTQFFLRSIYVVYKDNILFT